MDIKARAAYAWGRIVNLFSRKEPEIEVEFEELRETEAEEGIPTPPEATQADVLEEKAPEVLRGAEEEPLPSRMTEEYQAWLREQMEEPETVRESEDITEEETIESEEVTGE